MAKLGNGDFWKSRGRLQSIDVLRGVAAMAVVLSHIKHFRPNSSLDLRYWVLLPLEFGAMGVPLFVVLSGFCIHLGVAKQMARTGVIQADWVSFWKRRFYRLYPPYLAAIAFGLASYYIARPDVLNPWQLIVSLPGDVATHVLMVANLFKGYWAGVGNFPLWTLCMEEQLYILYALYIVFRRVFGVRVLAISLAVTVAWKLTHYTLLPTSVGDSPLEVGEWGKWPFDYWFNWVIGAIAAEAYAGALTLPPWCYRRAFLWIAATLGIATNTILTGRLGGSNFLTRQPYGAVAMRVLEMLSLASSPAMAVAFFILVNRWIRLESRGEFGGRVTLRLASVGLFSYSLYLTHVPTINLAEYYLGLSDGVDALAFRYVALPALCLAVAYVFYQTVESRFLNPTSSSATTKATLPS